MFIVFISGNKPIRHVYLRIPNVQYEVLLWHSNLILQISQADLSGRYIQSTEFDFVIFALDHANLSLHLYRNFDIPKYLIVSSVWNLTDLSHFDLHLLLLFYLQRINKG